MRRELSRHRESRLKIGAKRSQPIIQVEIASSSFGLLAMTLTPFAVIPDLIGNSYGSVGPEHSCPLDSRLHENDVKN